MVEEDRSAVSGSGVAIAVVLSVAMVMSGLAAPSTIGEFDRLFRGFGAELPWLTGTVLSFRIPILGVLLLSLMGQVVLLILLANRRTRDARRHFYRVTMANLAFFAVLVVAMYLPMFKLGAPV
jgi:type II secretory pathway component PulF